MATITSIDTLCCVADINTYLVRLADVMPTEGDVMAIGAHVMPYLVILCYKIANTLCGP